MKNNENTGNNIEINDENVENNVISDDNTEDTSANTDNSAEEKTTELTVEEQLEAAKKEVEQYKDKYLRAVAEFDNYRKRTLKEKAELLLNGSEKAVCAFLPILDDFERAIADKTEDVNVPGMGDDKKGKVIDCVQTGYQLNDKVIRHAKVAVGQ